VTASGCKSAGSAPLDENELEKLVRDDGVEANRKSQLFASED